MFKVIFTILLLAFNYNAVGQPDNSKAVLVKNKVKSILEKTCSGVCSAQYSEFDTRGNLIAFDFLRAGTRYRYIYNKQNEILMTLWIDKSESSKIDTLYPDDEYLHIKKRVYWEEYLKDGHLLIQSNEESEIRSFFNENCNLIEKQVFENDTLLSQENIKYDSQSRVVEKIKVNKQWLKILNSSREDKEKITALIERCKYNSEGQLIEHYKYFSDPCMGFDNHFLYIYTYHDNGLIANAEAFENGKQLAFTIEYEYDFF